MSLIWKTNARIKVTTMHSRLDSEDPTAGAFLPPILSGKPPPNSPNQLEVPDDLKNRNRMIATQKSKDKRNREQKSSDQMSNSSSGRDSNNSSQTKLPGLSRNKASSVSSLQPLHHKRADLARSPSCPVLPSDYDSDDELTIQDLSASTNVTPRLLHKKGPVDGIRLPEISGGSAASSPQPSGLGITAKYMKDVRRKSQFDPPSNRSTPRKLQQQQYKCTPAALLLPIKDKGYTRRTKKNRKSPPSVDKTSCQSITSDSGVSSDPQASDKPDKTIHNDVIEENNEAEVNNEGDYVDNQSVMQNERCRERSVEALLLQTRRVSLDFEKKSTHAFHPTHTVLLQ